PQPLDAGTARVQALAHQHLCSVSPALGDMPTALDSCRKSVALYDGLGADALADRTLRRQAAGAKLGYANALRLSGRPEEALSVSAQAINPLRSLATEEPTNAPVRLELATALTRQATIEAALSRVKEALSSYQEGVEVFDGLLAIDPSNQRVRTLLSYL